MSHQAPERSVVGAVAAAAAAVGDNVAGGGGGVAVGTRAVVRQCKAELWVNSVDTRAAGVE